MKATTRVGLRPFAAVTMKPSERLKRDIEALAKFHSAYIALINASKRVDEWPQIRFRPRGDEQRWLQLHREVSTAAGAAQWAYARQGGGTFTLRNAAYITNNVNPVSNWIMSIEDPESLKPQMILTAVEATIGGAEQDYEEALLRERGLIGLIAAFIRWPQSLREAVGPGWAPRTAAGAIGFIGQVVVGTLATALAAGLVALCVWLWNDVASPAFAPQPTPSASPTP